MRRSAWVGLAFIPLSVYMLGLGVAGAWAEGHGWWVGWWHPGWSAFLVCVSGSVGAFVHATETPLPPCRHCSKLKAKLAKATREVADTRQALLELAPLAAAPPGGQGEPR